MHNHGHKQWLSAVATATVLSFSPTPLGFVSVPGFANGIAVNGNYAYVAAGSAAFSSERGGSYKSNYRRRSCSPSNANGIRLVGNRAYIAAEAGACMSLTSAIR